MNVLDLFSGIGGFSLGLERAGMRTVAFCEIDPYCQRVLRRHWPDVPVYDDVRELAVDQGWLVSNTNKRCEPAEEQLPAGRQGIRADGIDVICGGFPCQDISVAGKGAGIGGERSGLWSEYARIIGEVRPRYVIVENVAALLGRGLATVLGDLAALGFDAEWHCIPASAVGAPHRRDRVWIVAYVPDADCGGWREQGNVGGEEGGRKTAGHAVQFCENVADADQSRRRRWAGTWQDNGRLSEPTDCGGDLGFASGPRLAIGPGTLAEWAHAATCGTGWWAVEPDVGRVVIGPAARVDRRKRLIALGNAVVPQIPEIIGRAIMMAE